VARTTGVLPRIGIATLIGPGLMVAATGVGSGDLAGATVAGANYGLVLIWAILLGAFLKFALTEGIARWQLATDSTVVEGWADHLPGWVRVYFGAYLVLWTVFVSAALANACGLGISHLTGGAISTAWGAVIHSLFGCAFVWVGGFAGFEKAMKLLIGLMVATLALCAALTFQDLGGTLKGALVPVVPAGSTASLLALIGGVGGTITILSYNYWMREEKIRGAAFLRYVRVDLVVAYTVTAVLAVAVLLLANRAFFVTGVDLNSATMVPQMAASLGTTLGPVGSFAYGIGFWGAVFSSLLGVWQSVPYLFADFYGIIKRYPAHIRNRLTQVTSTPYRVALLFITLVPIPLAFLQRPVWLLVAYTIVGSLFVPFLAATLLYLNNRVNWTSPVPRNGRTANAAMILALAFFLFVGLQDIWTRLRDVLGAS
jgi:Mn2+/Fe2+ NRAMP family transporter